MRKVAILSLLALTALAGCFTDIELVETRLVLSRDAIVFESFGDFRTLTATVTGWGGMPDTVVTWSSSNKNVATVDEVTGLVTAVGNESATITATRDRVYGSTTVIVEQAVKTVEVTPAEPATLTAIDETVQLTATARDANDKKVVETTFEWSSSNENVATVDEVTGLVTAVGNESGTATTITATSGGVSGNTTVTVELAMQTVEVTPVAINPQRARRDGPVDRDRAGRERQ